MIPRHYQDTRNRNLSGSVPFEPRPLEKIAKRGRERLQLSICRKQQIIFEQHLEELRWRLMTVWIQGMLRIQHFINLCRLVCIEVCVEIRISLSFLISRFFLLQLLKPSADHSCLLLVNETVEALAQVSDPVSVVTGVGTQRLGKSTLLNLFHSRVTCGFGLGHTLDAQVLLKTDERRKKSRSQST